jgi:hypothetical protein
MQLGLVPCISQLGVRVEEMRGQLSRLPAVHLLSQRREEGGADHIVVAQFVEPAEA